jgi:RNA polymerase sigma factor (sigma-70 family)
MEDWLLPLQQGRTEAAWDAFVTRYRRLIFATIRHYTQDYDDGMELFVRVCEKLRADDMQRLRVRAEDPAPRAQFSTWLVAVVRHTVVDWFRHRDGRRRLSTLAERLPALQRRIFELVFLEGRSHLETYEILNTRDGAGLTLREFNSQLRDTYRAVGKGRERLFRDLGPAPPHEFSEADPTQPSETVERNSKLQQALAELDQQDRLAVELYLLQEMPAEQVAQVLGLPNAKAVYNRVYRALAALRDWLGRAGIRAGDL